MRVIGQIILLRWVTFTSRSSLFTATAQFMGDAKGEDIAHAKGELATTALCTSVAGPEVPVA